MKISGVPRKPAVPRAVIGLILCATTLRISLGQTETVALQQRAIDRIEHFRLNYLKTGDSAGEAPELDQAAHELAATIEPFKKAGNQSATALSLLKLGEIHRLQNKYPQAFNFFQQAEGEAENSGDKKTQAQALIGLGRVELESKKDFAAARTHFREAATAAANLSDRAPLFNALGYEAEVETTTGNLVGAADLINRALALAPQVKDQSLLLFEYLDRADVFVKMAEKSGATKAFTTQLESLKLAQTDYEKARDIAREVQYAGLLPTIEQFLRHLQMRRQMAEMNARFSNVTAGSGVFAPKKPSDVFVSEKFVSDRVDLPAALIPMLRQQHMLDGTDARGLITRGHLYVAQGETDKALADYLKAIDLLEEDRRNLRDEQSRDEFFNDKIAFYYPAILQLLQRKRFPEAFELMERSRARAMTDLLFSKKLALAQPEAQTLFGDAQRLRSEIAALQKKLFDYRTRADRSGIASEIETAEKQIAVLEKQDRDLAARMAEKAPRLRELIVSQPASLKRVQEMLRRDGCDLLYYLALDEGVVLFHVDGEDVHARSILLPRSALKAKVSALRASVSSRDAKFDEKIARELFLFLIQPALGWIKTHQLILIPHAEMHYLPFAVLIDPSGKSLGEMFALSDAPNAGLLLDLKKGEAIEKGRLFAVADPDIEEARSEVETLAALYPDRNKTVIEPLIAEADVKSSAGTYDVLHFSVHGKFTPLEPMLSYLQFSKDAHDDGRLTAAEMFGLPLEKVRLVVLSACETGQAEATPGNEILGIERALLYAGANNLVLSSWPVDAASTALWMKTFHRQAQEKSLAEAARLALIEVKKEYPSPYYWAPFRLVGK